VADLTALSTRLSRKLHRLDQIGTLVLRAFTRVDTGHIVIASAG
jgi:hypothetical protein